jgi:hypothetical protein
MAAAIMALKATTSPMLALANEAAARPSADSNP